jgi:hypothetical protein
MTCKIDTKKSFLINSLFEPVIIHLIEEDFFPPPSPILIRKFASVCTQCVCNTDWDWFIQKLQKTIKEKDYITLTSLYKYWKKFL